MPIQTVWVANFSAFKRPRLFVQLARDLSHRQDLHFVMIGRPRNTPRSSELQQEMAQLDNLSFLGEQQLKK